mmetsp:Transcript_116123/g.217393  ORF Transcript_116123/g.217393 Transcript_116123/m.217393 type:complete len:221 (-) Transcript_116123:438-1100(-)
MLAAAVLLRADALPAESCARALFLASVLAARLSRAKFSASSVAALIRSGSDSARACGCSAVQCRFFLFECAIFALAEAVSVSETRRGCSISLATLFTSPELPVLLGPPIESRSFLTRPLRVLKDCWMAAGMALILNLFAEEDLSAAAPFCDFCDWADSLLVLLVVGSVFAQFAISASTGAKGFGFSDTSLCLVLDLAMAGPVLDLNLFRCACIAGSFFFW